MGKEDVFLVVGADGRVGRTLAERLKRSGRKVFETTRRREKAPAGRVFLDLEKNPASFNPPAGVTAAFLCAWITSMEACHKDPRKTAAVNVTSTSLLAEQLTKRGIFTVFLSSNRVFDGTVSRVKAETPVSPVTAYGKQKAQAEKKILASGALAAVVRFSKILSENDRLMTEWTRSLKSKKVIRPFSDMPIAPVPLSLAADVLLRVAETRKAGVFQVSGKKDISYEALARLLAKRLKADEALIHPITAAEAGRFVDRVPEHTTLDTARVEGELGLKIPEIEAVLKTVVG